MTWLEIVGAVIVAGSTMLAVIYPAQRRARASRQLLEALRARRGGTVEALGVAGGHRLRFVVDELTIEVELMQRSSSLLVAVSRVMIPSPGAPTFEVRPEGATSYLAKLAGHKDLELGDDDFDIAHFVTADDLPATRRMLTPARCRRLHLTQPAARLSCKRDRLVLDRPAPAHVDGLDQGVDLIVELARVDVFGIAALRSLPDATLQANPDGLPCAEIKGPGGIKLGVDRGAKVATTRAWRTIDDGARFGTFDVIDGRYDDATTTLAPAVRARLCDLGTARFVGSAHEVEIRWLEIEDRRERLIAAIEVLQRLDDGPSFGAFR